MNKKVILLNGSPRKKGTSFSFARTMKALMEGKGYTVEILHIIEYIDQGKSMEDEGSLLRDAHIIGLCSPLYVDSLPYPVINFFEKLHFQYKEMLKGKDFFAVGQCAFPYPDLIENLTECCRCFAEAVGMNWLGGLRYGGGVIINGAFLEQLGKKGEKITRAFDMALEDVLNGKAISQEIQQKLSRSFPKIFSRPGAVLLNKMVKAKGKKDGFTVEDMSRKAYL